jgi:dihydrofolate synthase/folylpolyglutamate synthase
MNYQQTIDYLFSRLPMFSRIGAQAFKKDLTNIIRLCHYLGNPHQQFKSIHIAGTNGKGSVSHMLAAILQTAGYKTGLYTSPHLKDFRERIKISGEMVSEQFVIDFTERIKPLIEEMEPSFSEQKIDVAVIEVGLGGRLDSTNIINPELAVITNIGWDHMNMLGDTLEKIAFEKAGIIKHNIPVVVGEVLRQTEPVFEKAAKEKNASLSIASQKRTISAWQWINHELVAETELTNSTGHQVYHLDLIGIYQLKNLITVLEACSQLKQKGWKLTDEIIHKALQQVRKLTGLHGRWEIIHRNPPVILDVAHNEDGIKQLTEQIEVTNHNNLHIILGMVKDKEIEKIVSLLPKQANYYFTKAQIPRALPENELAAKAAAAGLKGNIYSDVNTALQAALNKAHQNDLVMVCGSVFLVGEVKTSIHSVFPTHT